MYCPNSDNKHETEENRQLIIVGQEQQLAQRKAEPDFFHDRAAILLET